MLKFKFYCTKFFIIGNVFTILRLWYLFLLNKWAIISGHETVSDSLQPHGLHQAPLSFIMSWSLLKFMSFMFVMLSNHLILCHPLLLLRSTFLSIRVFSSELARHMRQSNYCSFSFSISPSNQCWEIISFRIDLFDLLTVQGTLESLLQHHNSKASILWYLAFFMIQLSHPYMSLGRTVALPIPTSVGKVASLLFNMMFMFVIVFFQGASFF